MILLNGKKLASQRFSELKVKLQSFAIKPKLVGILVGDNPSSHIYVNHKKQACEKLGALCDILYLSAKYSQDQLLQTILKLNEDKSVTGILLQLPLPKHLEPLVLMNAISPNKDVDGLTAKNMGLLLQKSAAPVPCTAKGISNLLQNYDIPVKGMHVVIIGRSLIVGLPISILLQQQGATVTLCHSATVDLKSFTQKADIVVVSIGKKYFLDHSYFKQNAVVVDVGINNEDGKLYGDVCSDKLGEVLKAYSPVPGGVGPMTIQTLMENLVLLHREVRD